MKYRFSFQKILKGNKSKKISILIGPRQVGKTTILKELNKVLGGLYLDLDIFSNFEKVSTYENFINTLRLEGFKEKQKKFFYIFLDEFQNYKDLTKVMKNIYDNFNNIKIYASGSSSLTIKNKIQESLSGRKHITHIYPLSFNEFLIFKEKENLIKKINNLNKININNYFSLIPELKALLNEFLIYGAYPAVVLEKNKKIKIEILNDIFDLYIKKDLIDYLNISKISNFKTLIQYLSINNGGLTNFSEIAQIASIDTKTAIDYSEILKETFLIEKLKPFFKRKNKEISKMPKIYFLDNGVRNFFCNNFNEIDLRKDAGILFEAFCISEIIKNGENSENLKYYRSKSGIKVDIIIDRISEVIPIEVKYKNNLINSDTANLQNFISQYKTTKNYLINRSEINKKGEIKKISPFNLVFK